MGPLIGWPIKLQLYGLINFETIDSALLTSSNVNADGFIDIGKCVGSCRKANAESYHVSKYYRQRKIKRSKESDLTCVPKKFEILKTQFELGKQLVEGPNVDGLIVTDCSCSTYFHCN